MMGEYGWFGHGYGWLFMIPVWALVIVGIVAIVKWAASSTPRSETPLEILKARYARGEIDKKEYERMRRELLQ